MRQEYERHGLRYTLLEDDVVEGEESEYANADAISVLSNFALETFVKNGVARSKLWLNPVGVDLSKFWPAPTIRNDPEFQILFVGGITYRKGVFYLLEAVRTLAFPYTLKLVGIGNPEVSSLVGRPKTDGRIEFLGHRSSEEIRLLMSSADVLVLPSIEDGFGMVILEALACGCPVIASRNSGGPDVIATGVDGFIVEPGDKTDLSEKLALISGWQNDKERVRHACVQKAKAFGGTEGWSSYGERYLDNLTHALQDCTPSGDIQKTVPRKSPTDRR
jgi:glycosyltransferase involved in cell wall biosynthesis